MADTVDILGLTSDQLAQAAALALPSGAGAASAIYRQAFHEHRVAPDQVLPPLSARSIAAWSGFAQHRLLRVVRAVDESGALGTTSKAILATHDGYEIECVRIPMRVHDDGSEDQTLCISSQVGCRMGCTFCETGRMGLIRNLSAAEIVAQVATVRAQLQWNPRNLVFMGMGEALDNVDNVIQALRVLTDRRGLHFSHERITICTSGHAEGLAAVHALGWKRLNLSISLNGARDELRSRIMPVNRRTPLRELQRILAAFPQRRNFCLGVNWCLMPGINDSAQDAADIAAFVAPLGRVLLNLIPYNPGNAPIAAAPSEDDIERFLGWLRGHGVAVRRRITKGRSIMAACGQLGNVELRAVAQQRRSARRVPEDPDAFARAATHHTDR